MNIIPQTLSLKHQMRMPKSAPQNRPPLFLMLHGYGSNASDLISLAPFLDERLLVVSAEAPISLGGGARAWFDLQFTALGLVGDLAQAQESLNGLKYFIREVVDSYGPDPTRIYVSGFSQGSIMSLAVTLTDPDLLAGTVLLSGKLPDLANEVQASTSKFVGLPIFVAHGVHDQTLPIGLGREQREFLNELPFALTYKEYDMGHEVNQQCLSDVKSWLTTALDGPRRMPVPANVSQ